MADLLTSDQMRAIEAAAIAAGTVTGLDLMERAGQGVVDAILQHWPELAFTSGKAVVLCGPGNNGGDGFVVARLLHRRGWQVAVYATGQPESVSPDARENRRRWTELGAIQALEALQVEGADLVVDALFGVGLNRAYVPPTDLGAFFHGAMADNFWVHGRVTPPRIVAIDVPSGLCADSGRVLWGDGDWVGEIGAHLTVTFHAPKIGHFIADGPQVCGALRVVDIGLAQTAEGVPLTWPPDPLRAQVALMKGPGARAPHKYGYGHALIQSGPMGRSGAARLAAGAALRVGAGLVTVAAPGSAMLECAAHLTAIMLRRCDSPKDVTALLADARLNALCLGPGLGQDRARDLVPAALSSNRPTVLDADALTAFADNPEALFALVHRNTILTPHGGEFARLFPDIAAKLKASGSKGPAYSKLDATRAAAARAGCVVLYKGADTVIADPGGGCAINAAAYDRVAPWLATAGSGDVLAGLITGLLARGFDPMQAAQTGAWLHVEAARAFGPGLIAEDLSEMLPQVLRDLAAPDAAG